MTVTAEVRQGGPVRLLREAAFRRYWSAQTVSLVGDQITVIAVPLLAVLAVDAGPAQMGCLTAAALLPNLFFSLPAGAWADRRPDKRRIMILADVSRAFLLFSVPLLWWAGLLTLPLMCVVSFAVGVFSVLFEVAHASLFASLVRRPDYVDANTLINGSRAGSFVIGPSLGGLLVQTLTAPIALVADALTFLASAVFLTRVRIDDGPISAASVSSVSASSVSASPDPVFASPDPVSASSAPASPASVPASSDPASPAAASPAVAPAPASPASGMLAGVRFVARSAVLRALLLGATTLNLFNYIFAALWVLYATTELDVAPGTLGVIIGLGAFGGLIGAAIAGPLSRRIGLGPAVILGYVLFPAPLILVPLAGGPRWVIFAALFAAEFLGALGVMILDITGGSAQTAATPPSMLAVVSGFKRTVNYGIRPIGALIGGGLGATIGVRESLWIATAGAVLGALWVYFSPLRTMHDLPPSEWD